MPKIANPTLFDGEPKNVPTFIKDCNLHFTMKADIFGENEAVKIGFILSWCKGPKIDNWVNMIFESLMNNDLMAPISGRALLQQIQNHFGNRNAAMMARIKMDKFSQVGSAEQYIIGFQTLSPRTGYGETELIHKFITGLKENLCSKCFRIFPLPDTLEDWYTIARSLQNQLNLEASFKSNRAGQFAGSFGCSGSSQITPQQTAPKASTPGGSRTYGRSGQAMDLGRQKQCCSTCNCFGHTTENCR